MADLIGFRTKKALEEAVRALVNRQEYNRPIEGEERELLLRLFQNHPDYEQKLGPGVAAVMVRYNRHPEQGFRGTRGLWLVREDGSEVDISWRECIYPTPHRRKVRTAFRIAIAGQLEAFRRKHFEECAERGQVTCPLTGEQVSSKDCDIDHVAPLTFEQLVTDFLTREGITETDIALAAHCDGDYGDKIADHDLVAKWAEYHRVNAILRVLSKVGHRNLKSK